MKCFVLGLIGLVPVLGLPFAVSALNVFFRVKRRRGLEWNPAQRYLAGGALCGCLGLILTLIVVGIIAAAVLNSYSNHSGHYYFGSPNYDRE